MIVFSVRANNNYKDEVKMPQKISKFPAYLVAGMATELPIEMPTSLQDAQELKWFSRADQYFDMLNALDYAEKSFLPLDIKSFTAATLENFFLELNKRLAHSLNFFTSYGALAGTYSSRRALIIKEAEDPNYTFSPDAARAFSQHDFEILKKMYGPQAADNYQDFCQKLREKVAQETQKIIFAQAGNRLKIAFFSTTIDIVELIESSELKTHPGYKEHQKTVTFSKKPAVAQALVKNTCTKIAKMMQENQDPFAIVAEALMLAKAHPLHNGNGKTTRLFINSILMIYGYRPADFEANKKAFYKLIENDDSSLTEKINFIKKLSEAAAAQDINTHVLPNDLPYSFQFFADEEQLFFCKHHDRIDVVNDTQFKLYSRMDSIKKMTYNPPAHLSPPTPDAPQKIREQTHQVLKKLAQLVIDADYCFKKAKQYENSAPSVAIYYCLRAADFYLLDPTASQKAADCYLNAVLLCTNTLNIENAYIFAEKALAIYGNSSVSENAEKAASFIEKLKFVPEYNLKSTPSVLHESKLQNYSSAMFLPAPKTTDTRKWATKESRNQFYPLLDGLAEKLQHAEIVIKPADKKFTDFASKVGWILYEMTSGPFLAVLNFDNETTVEKLKTLIAEKSSLEVKSYNQGKSIGIFFPKEVDYRDKIATIAAAITDNFLEITTAQKH